MRGSDSQSATVAHTSQCCNSLQKNGPERAPQKRAQPAQSAPRKGAERLGGLGLTCCRLARMTRDWRQVVARKCMRRPLLGTSMGDGGMRRVGWDLLHEEGALHQQAGHHCKEAMAGKEQQGASQ